MVDSGEKRKGVAKCSNCEEISPVEIWPDGTVHPLGRSEICDCAGGRLEILEGEDSVDEA